MEKPLGLSVYTLLLKKDILKSIQYGVTQTYEWTKQIFIILGDLVTGGFTIDSLSGPVGIYKSTEEVATARYFYVNEMGSAT